MKKLRLCGIVFALFLITGGLSGFVYLIYINGAGPELSWGLGMGPLVVGIALLLITAEDFEKNEFF